ncbi:hypothetical protein GCK32_013211, partial [Trichostrongylus colubriformis]
DRFSVEEISEDSIERGDLVQMDSIPEDTTVSLSESTLSFKVPLLRQYGVESSKETSEWSQMNLKDRLETFGKRLSKWFDSLDYDGDFMSIQWVSDSHSSTYVGQKVSLFAEVLSTGVILIALFELYESSLQCSYSLHSYCDNLIRAIIEMIFADLKQLTVVRLEDIAPIHQFCSQFVLHIFNEIDFIGLRMDDTLDTLDVPHGDISPSRSSTASPLSACYEILRVDSDSTTSESSSYASFEYPSESETVIEHRDSYEDHYEVPEISSLQAITASVDGAHSPKDGPPFERNVISPLTDPHEYTVVPDLSWLEALVASGVDIKERAGTETPKDEAEDRDFWSTNLEGLREGIEQVTKYELEPLDESLLSPVTQKLPQLPGLPESSPTTVEYTLAMHSDELHKNMVDRDEEFIQKPTDDTKPSEVKYNAFMEPT